MTGLLTVGPSVGRAQGARDIVVCSTGGAQGHPGFLGAPPVPGAPTFPTRPTTTKLLGGCLPQQRARTGGTALTIDQLPACPIPPMSRFVLSGLPAGRYPASWAQPRDADDGRAARRGAKGSAWEESSSAP